MSNQPSTTFPIVHLSDGKLTTTSLNIAKVFNKPHRDVTKAIRSLDIPQEFSLRNFSQSDFKTPRGKTYPMYEITRDGFTLLAMGFTGRKAMAFKLAYIDMFNQMEAELKNQQRNQSTIMQAECKQKIAEVESHYQRRLIEQQEEVLELYRFKVQSLEAKPTLSPKRRPFTAADTELLVKLVGHGKSNREIADMLDRKIESIASKRRQLGILAKVSAS